MQFRHNMFRAVVIGSSMLLATLGAAAGDTREAIDAYLRGDYATALRLLSPLAQNGDPISQFYLGLMYGNGQGVTQNYVEQFKWFRRAAGQGDTIAQASIAAMYRDGTGVPQSFVHAHMWFNVAAALGDPAAAEGLQILAQRMTSAQIIEAQTLAQQCAKSNYKTCEFQAKLTKNQSSASHLSVPLEVEGGTFVVPVGINGVMTLNFVIDSGASRVSVPADVVSTLIRAGAVKKADFVGSETYVMADGSKVQSQTFLIRSLKVGDTIIENVMGSIAPAKGELLLGQSFLTRFKSWSIDNANQKLILERR